ncbi:hypothetical protein TNCV_1312191 [Trichonephila clavipes]|nr:hypothetical protein TNCV_1312191 [Trichonephila clavipes]
MTKSNFRVAQEIPGKSGVSQRQRPPSTTDDLVQKVRQVLDKERRLSVWMIAEECEIPPNNHSSHSNAFAP